MGYLGPALYKTLFAYTFIVQLHLGLRGASNRGWTGIRYRFCVTSRCFEWRLQASMAHDHCCVNFCSNDKRNKSGENLSFFNFPSNARRYWARWRAGFRGKSRVVTDKLLEARVISDPLFLSIEDLASSFFMTIEPYWIDKELRSLLSYLLVRKFFLPLQFFLLVLFALLGPCKLRCFRRVSPVIVLYISSGLKWAEHTRVEPFFIWQIRFKPHIITLINEGESHYCILPNPS